eukprot:1491257-Rhodomonas_salina.2
MVLENERRRNVVAVGRRRLWRRGGGGKERERQRAGQRRQERGVESGTGRQGQRERKGKRAKRRSVLGVLSFFSIEHDKVDFAVAVDLLQLLHARSHRLPQHRFSSQTLGDFSEDSASFRPEPRFQLIMEFFMRSTSL